MKQHIKHLLASLVLALGFCGNANAILLIPGTINWEGICLDCNGLGGAPSMAWASFGVDELANINGGNATDIGGMNLMSFEYYSNIFPFGLRAADIVYASGMISTDSQTMATMMIYFHAEVANAQGVFGPASESTWTFRSSYMGRWELLEGLASFDFGHASTFNVPEPTAVLLMISGFAGLTVLRKRVPAKRSCLGFPARPINSNSNRVQNSRSSPCSLSR